MGLVLLEIRQRVLMLLRLTLSRSPTTYHPAYWDATHVGAGTLR